MKKDQVPVLLFIPQISIYKGQELGQAAANHGKLTLPSSCVEETQSHEPPPLLPGCPLAGSWSEDGLQCGPKALQMGCKNLNLHPSCCVNCKPLRYDIFKKIHLCPRNGFGVYATWNSVH